MSKMTEAIEKMKELGAKHQIAFNEGDEKAMAELEAAAEAVADETGYPIFNANLALASRWPL